MGNDGIKNTYIIKGKGDLEVTEDEPTVDTEIPVEKSKEQRAGGAHIGGIKLSPRDLVSSPPRSDRPGYSRQTILGGVDPVPEGMGQYLQALAAGSPPKIAARGDCLDAQLDTEAVHESPSSSGPPPPIDFPLHPSLRVPESVLKSASGSQPSPRKGFFPRTLAAGAVALSSIVLGAVGLSYFSQTASSSIPEAFAYQEIVLTPSPTISPPLISPVVAFPQVISIAPSSDPSLAGKGISSYIVAAYQHAEDIAVMNTAEKAHAIATADIHALSSTAQQAALADIKACVVADRQSTSPVLKNHNPTKLADGKANVLPLDAQLTCTLSLPASEIGESAFQKGTPTSPSAPSLHFDQQTGQLMQQSVQHTLSDIVTHYVLLGIASVDVAGYSASERLTAAVEAYRTAGNKHSVVYKTLDEIATAFGVSEKKIVASSKETTHYSRKTAEAKAREERRVLADQMYARQNYEGAQSGLVKELCAKYGVSASTARADLRYAREKYASQQVVVKSIETRIAEERMKSIYDAPEPVTLQMKKRS